MVSRVPSRSSHTPAVSLWPFCTQDSPDFKHTSSQLILAAEILAPKYLSHIPLTTASPEGDAVHPNIGS